MKRYLVLLIALGAVPAIAQVPSGSFSYNFTNAPLWDVSGSYTNHIATSGGTDTVIIDLTQSATGTFTGTRKDSVTDGTVVNENITGKVIVKGGIPSASLMMKGTVSAFGFEGTATGKGTGTLHPEALTIEVAGALKACVKTPQGTKCETFTADTTSPLPAEMNGDWTLDTEITATGSKLTGTGTLTLSNGRVLTYQITGTYSTVIAVAKLKLSGTGNASKTSLSVTTHGVGMDLTSLKGKVLGQTLALQ